MAGIGFELRRLNRNDTFLGVLKAYTASGIISGGPWIISILSIAALSVILKDVGSSTERLLVPTTVTHVYAFMLILTGPFSLVLTRHAADAFSEKAPQRILPAYLAALTLVCLLAALFSAAFFMIGVPSASLLYQLAATALSVLVAAVFITTNYLGALKSYTSILIAFFCGYSLACALAFDFTSRFTDPAGAAIAGFVIGHLLIFVLLFTALYRELPGGAPLASNAFFRSLRLFPSLAFCGLFYNAGIWIDKLLFWWLSPDRMHILGAIYAAPAYDMAVYLSILSIVPGMAVFCLKLETDFARDFTDYFKCLNENASLQTLIEAKQRVSESLRDGLVLLARVQGITTVLLLVFADRIAGLMGAGAFQLGVFRITLVGSFFLVLFLALITVLFYFDDRRGALGVSVVFFFTNGLVALLTILAGLAFYGGGYVIATGLAFALAAYRVNRHLATLEYRIFAALPVT